MPTDTPSRDSFLYRKGPLDDAPALRQLPTMPDVAAAIAEPERRPKFRFTKSNAAAFARRAVEARLRNLEAEGLEAQERLAASLEASPDARLDLLTEQIVRTRKALNTDDLEPHHRAALLRALCELLDQQRIARGEPLPGSRRPAADRSPRAAWPPTLVPRPAPAPAPLVVSSTLPIVCPSDNQNLQTTSDTKPL